jgi:hypothetical protein
MSREDEGRSVTSSASEGDAVVAELLGWLVLANAAAWTAWSLLTGEYGAGVPALVNGPVAIVILHRLLTTRHAARRSESDAELRESPRLR